MLSGSEVHCWGKYFVSARFPESFIQSEFHQIGLRTLS